MTKVKNQGKSVSNNKKTGKLADKACLGPQKIKKGWKYYNYVKV